MAGIIGVTAPLPVPGPASVVVLLDPVAMCGGSRGSRRGNRVCQVIVLQQVLVESVRALVG